MPLHHHHIYQILWQTPIEHLGAVENHAVAEVEEPPPGMVLPFPRRSVLAAILPQVDDPITPRIAS